MKRYRLFYFIPLATLLFGLLFNLVWIAEAAPIGATESSHNPKKVGGGDGQPSHFPIQPILTIKSESPAPAAVPVEGPLESAPVLTITKSANPDPGIAGDTLTYTIIVANNSITEATNVVITDTLDGNVIYNSASDGGTHNSGVVVWAVSSIPGGETISRTLLVTVGNVTSGTILSNIFEVTSSEGGADSGTLDTPVIVSADLAISKSNNKNGLVPGEQTTYTIIVTNNGPSNVTGATVTDNFPSMSGITWSCTPSSGANCTASSAGNINDTVDIPVGGSITYMATGTVDPGARGTLANTASVAVPAGAIDPVSGNNSATDTDNLSPKADVGVTKSDSPDPVIAGNNLTYNLTVTNNGPSDATQVKLTDNLPSGVSFISATPGSPTCTESGGTVICNLGTVAKGASVPVTIQANVSPSLTAGGLINLAQVERAELDENGANDLASASTTVQIRTDLAISKSDSPDPVSLGNQLTYTLNVVNNGPSNATGVEVTDVLPAQVNFVSVATNKGSCSGTSTITCSLGNMSKDETATITIVVAPQTAGTFSNTASVTGNETDPTGSNNSDTINTTFNKRTDLSVTNISSPNPVFPGGNLTYNLTVTNNGPSNATSVTLTNVLPGSDVALNSVTTSKGSCSGTSTITCNIGNLASGSSAQITIVVTVNSSASGVLSNSASVTGSEIDPDTANNSSTTNTSVGQFKFVYLPFIVKPEPTELWVKNTTTGNVTFVVRDLGTNAEITRCTVASGATIPCDHDNDGSNIFSPGIYKVVVSANCGSNTFNKTYDSGKQVTKVFCK